MLGLAPALLSLIGYSYFFSLVTRWPFATTPLFTVSLLIVINYIAALSGELNLFSTCTLYLGYSLFLACSLYELLVKRTISIVKEPSFIFFVLLTLLIWLRIHSLEFNAWDEFSHWGPRIKTLFMTDTLFKAQQHLVHIDYPPGSAIFQYFLLKAEGSFSESLVYLAQNLLIIAALISLLQNLSWKQSRLCFLILAAGLLVVGPAGLSTIYVDNLVGLYFASLVTNYLLADNKTSALFRLIPTAMCLSLFKDSAGGLLLVSCSCLVFLIIMDYFKQTSHSEHKSELLKNLLVCILILFSALMSAYSWHYYVEINQLPIGNLSPYNISLQKLTSLIHSTSALQKSILELFLCKANALALKFILIFGIICYLLNRIYENSYEKLRDFGLLILLGLGFIAYLLALLYSYLFNFSEGEALRLASMNRYVNTYYICLLITSLTLFLKNPLPIVKLKYVYWGVSFILVIAFLSAPAKNIQFWLKGGKPNAERHQIQHTILALRPLIPENAKVFIVWKEAAGEGNVITRYELFPRPYNNSCWSINLEKHQECNFNEFKLMLKEYDYLYLGNPDSRFLDKLQQEFPAATNKSSLYKILPSDDTELKFEAVEPREKRGNAR